MSEAQRPHRLDQLLSRYGYCSRSEARTWLARGRVTVNGTAAKSTSDKARPADVRIDGEPIEHLDGFVALLNKPAGFVCSHDEREGKNVFELLPPRWLQRNPPVAAVGRLDKDTTGALLLTDQGQLVQHWTSPRHKVSKIYEVTVDGDLTPELIPIFGEGKLMLDGEDKPCHPASLTILSPRDARLELTEGRYHQVKRMFASQGLAVTRLHRSQFGDFTLEGLEPGQWRIIEPAKWSEKNETQKLRGG